MDTGVSPEEVPPLRVGITYNLRRSFPSSETEDLFEEYDSEETILSLEREIQKYHCTPLRFEQDHTLQKRLQHNPPDFVFNIAEGLGQGRGREAQVPCLLESLGIPFSGSDSIAMGITLDKYLCQSFLAHAHIPVPEMLLLSPENMENTEEKLLEKYGKVLVKPRWEGSSKGVFADSLATNREELLSKARRIWDRYNQPALLEEYLPGEEYTVALIGNKAPRISGIMRIRPKHEEKDFLYSLFHKREWEERVCYEGPEVLDDYTRTALEHTAIRAFRTLELHDFARIDFRKDSQGIPRIIDVNPLPGLRPGYGDFTIASELSGNSYEEILRDILMESLERWALLRKEKTHVGAA
ncbi:MAG TPA: ATP-grasp domain-containing protein [Synergistaceae bacterium]|nr:ATP-grasp domain-containing protein [Synergistaceae bacterium]HPJ24533.1 ATP-grasp domain-containing protein [Synergistaceae bacterium]HPQ36290.1 ATP-grasp domain-containing protein [Synergistaceae bacterium]